jgi:hypothetical protein
MNRKFAVVGASCILAASLAACAPSSTPTDPPETVAAKTMEVILTEIAGQIQLTQSMAPSPTSTITPTPTIIPTVDLGAETPIGITPLSTPGPPTPTTNPDLLKTRTITGKCNAAFFVDDITYEDFAEVKANMPFTKTWAIRNIGFCTWNRSYQLRYYGGAGSQHMGGSNYVNFPEIVPPNDDTWLSVDLFAPKSAGVHFGRWYLYDAEGDRFGVGVDGYDPLIVKITVVL